MSWSNFCLRERNWSSLLQETSSTPWRHLVLTSCWGGKAGTLLWAHSRSTRSRAPRFLESRPRGGDWSGHYFDINPTLFTVMDFSVLTNSECGLLYMPFTCAPAKHVLPKHQDQDFQQPTTPGLIKHFIPPAAFTRATFPLFQTVCITNLHQKEEQWMPLPGCFWCWHSSLSQVALNAFSFILTRWIISVLIAYSYQEIPSCCVPQLDVSKCKKRI